MRTKEQEQCEQEWQAAEAALKDAQKLPGVPARFEALKKAGQLRYDADRRRRAIDDKMDRSKTAVRRVDSN